MKLFNYVIIKRKKYDDMRKEVLEAQVETIKTLSENLFLSIITSVLKNKIKQLEAKQPNRNEKGQFAPKKTNADVQNTNH